MYHFNLYKSQSNWYKRLVHVASGQIWDNANGLLSANPAWNDTAIALTFNAHIGGHPITLPAGLPQGDYDVLFYDSEVPGADDAVIVHKVLKWNGSMLGYIVPQVLDI